MDALAVVVETDNTSKRIEVIQPPLGYIFALLQVLSLGTRLMNCASRVSNIGGCENLITKLSSRGDSIRSTKSSKYSLTPLNVKSVREGRRVRVGGYVYVRRLSRSLAERSPGNLKDSRRNLSRVEAGGHRLWRNVPGIRNPIKIESGEVSGG